MEHGFYLKQNFFTLGLKDFIFRNYYLLAEVAFKAGESPEGQAFLKKEQSVCVFCLCIVCFVYSIFFIQLTT